MLRSRYKGAKGVQSQSSERARCPRRRQAGPVTEWGCHDRVAGQEGGRRSSKARIHGGCAAGLWVLAICSGSVASTAGGLCAMACDGCGNVADAPTLRADCFDAEESRRQKALKASGAQLITGRGVQGVRIAGWSIQTRKAAILRMGPREKLEKMLETSHLPEMVFGDNSLELVHEATGVKIHFDALDALRGWRQESLPPVEVPAAAKWRCRMKPDEQLILNYDYTFTTPYAGSQCVENTEGVVNGCVEWVESQERIDMAALQARDPILFFDEVVLYEDELADNGISLLTAKVRVMPTCWFLLLRFWLRVDGALMRVRDTRMFCRMQSGTTAFPVILRERIIKEDTFEALASKGYPSDSAMYNDPTVAGERLTLKRHVCEVLTLMSTK